MWQGIHLVAPIRANPVPQNRLRDWVAPCVTRGHAGGAGSRLSLPRRPRFLSRPQNFPDLHVNRPLKHNYVTLPLKADGPPSPLFSESHSLAATATERTQAALL